MKRFFVYILANQPKGALYVGVTSHLARRVTDHRNHTVPGHTQRYSISHLVYFEVHENAESAILREKQLKR